MKSIHDSYLFELVNDYRDTLYYSAIAVISLAYMWFRGPFLAYQLFSDLVWMREFIRWFFWIRQNPSYIPIIGFMCFSDTTIVNMIGFLHDPSHMAAWRFFGIALNSVFLVSYIFQVGSPKTIIKIWWKQLFDWPRKQKPPKRRLEQALDKIKQLMEEMMPIPALIPSRSGTDNASGDHKAVAGVLL